MTSISWLTTLNQVRYSLVQNTKGVLIGCFIVNLINGFLETLKLALIFLIFPFIGLPLPEGLEQIQIRVRSLVQALGFQEVFGTILFIISFLVLTTILSALSSWMQSSIAQGFSLRLRIALIKSILNSKWSYLRNKSFSDLNSAINIETNRAQSAVIKLLFSINNGFSAVIFLLGSLYFSPIATMIIGSIGICILGIGLVSTKLLLKRSQQISQDNLSLISRSSEFIRNLKTLKATNSGKQISGVIQGDFEKLFHNERLRYLIPDFTKSLTESLSILAILISVVAIKFFVEDQEEINVLVSLAFFSRISSKANSAMNYFQQAILELPAIDFTTTLLKEIEINSEPPEVSDPIVECSKIIIRDLHLQYKDHKVLENINIILESGKLNAFVGKSGSGKTSLMDALLGLNEFDGRIIINGQEYRGSTLTALRSSSAYVSQNTTLLDVSIQNNIRLFKPDASYEEVEKAAKFAGAHEFIIRMPEGYSTELRNDGINLSGGQRQRIAIARALLKNPKILFLDEATSALDERNEAAVMETIRDIARHMIVVLITHREHTLKKSDVIYVFENLNATSRN